MFTLVHAIVWWPPSGMRDLLPLLLGAVLGIGVSFPIVYGFLTVGERARKWWHARRPQDVAPSMAPVETFRWSGRPIQANKTGIAAALLLVAIFASIFLVLPTPDQAVLTSLFVVIVLLACLSAIAVGAALIPLTCEVDDAGIRYRRRFDRGVTATWAEIGRIDLFSFDSFPFRGYFDFKSLTPRMFAVIRKDNSRAVALQPRMELGGKLGELCEQALEIQASRHGVPIKNVRSSDMVPWRRGRRGPMEDRESPPSTGEIR
jgi:hypothetical protein